MSKAKNIKPKVIEDSEEDSDSSIPIVAVKPTKKEKVEEKKAVKKVAKKESSEEEDTPVVEKKPVKQAKTEVAPVKKVVAKKVAKESSSEESEEEAPKKVVAKVKSPVQKAVVQKKKVPESSEESSEEEAPKAPVKAAKAVQKVASPVQKVVKKPVESSSEESEEEVKPAKKAVKSPVQKAKSPVQKAKSPVQKAQPTKKPVVESSEESEEEVKPVAKKPAAKVVAKKVKSESSEQQSEEKPAPKKSAKVAAKKESSESEQQKPAPKKQAAKPVAAKPAAKKVEPIEEEKPADEEGSFEICVRGLSFQAYDSDIRDFFNECGNVLEVRLLTRDDGKSKGTAFVKFSKKSSFNKALGLNGAEHMGRNLTIEESQGKKPYNAGGFGGAGGQKSYPQGNTAVIETPTLFIGGLSYNSTAESIQAFFAQAGQVSSARVVTDKETGKPRGFGYVEFHDVDTAKKAYAELNGGYLDGRAIRLDSASQRDRPQGNFGGQGGFGGGQGGFGGARGAPRNNGNSTVDLSQDDKNAKKGSIGTFAGKKISL